MTSNSAALSTPDNNSSTRNMVVCSSSVSPHCLHHDRMIHDLEGQIGNTCLERTPTHLDPVSQNFQPDTSNHKFQTIPSVKIDHSISDTLKLSGYWVPHHRFPRRQHRDEMERSAGQADGAGRVAVVNRAGDRHSDAAKSHPR